MTYPGTVLRSRVYIPYIYHRITQCYHIIHFFIRTKHDTVNKRNVYKSRKLCNSCFCFRCYETTIPQQASGKIIQTCTLQLNSVITEDRWKITQAPAELLGQLGSMLQKTNNIVHSTSYPQCKEVPCRLSQGHKDATIFE